MARPEGTPVNDNPELQAKLEGQGDPAPAPAPAPAEPAPSPEPAPAEEPAPSPEPVELPEPSEPTPSEPAPQWEKTGSESLDTIGALFDEKGVDGKHFREELLKTGEISKETYDALVESLGTVSAQLVANQAKSAVGELKSAAAEEAKKIHSAVGGEEQWKQIADWSKSGSLQENERAEYNALLRAGGKAAELAAKELKERMMADPNFKSRADLIGSGDTPAAAGQPAQAQLLDRKTYTEKIRQAEQRGDLRACETLRKQALHAMKHNPNWKIGNA